MIEIYCKLIQSKRRLFTQVPDNLKEQVRARLLELGFDTDGNPITE
jgi:hypothetical protein